VPAHPPNRKAPRSTARRLAIVAAPIRNLAGSRITGPRAVAARQTGAGARGIHEAAPEARFASRPVPPGRSFRILG
jgi:hypothetical protein